MAHAGDIQMTCKELVELVTDYLEGALPPRDVARFEEHIVSCPPCHTHLDQMRRTIEVVGRIPEQALSPEAEHHLLEAFRNWKRG
jgi:anti-sigma factor RsiW